MKILSNTMKYMYKNFFQFLLFAIIPAFFVGAFYEIFGVSYFMVNYKDLVVNSLGDILGLLLNISWTDLLMFFLSSILLIFSLSIMFGGVEYNFRSGKRELKNISHFINNNIMVIISYYLITILLVSIFKLILGVSIFTLHLIVSGLGNLPSLGMHISAIAIIVALGFLFIFAMNYILIALPITITTGYSIRSSVTEANELLYKRHFKSAMHIIIPMILSVILTCIGYVFGLEFIFNTLVVLFLVVYIPVLSMTSYYEYALIKRYDNRGLYYYK